LKPDVLTREGVRSNARYVADHPRMSKVAR